jgi:uncharacterized membrane protein YhaH (DUF805 family)
MQEMFAPFMRYADFSGRSRRLEYWLFSLFHGFISIILLSGFVSSMIVNRGVSGMSSTALNFLTLFVFWIMATFIPMLAVTVRRFHDMDKSGWFYFISLIPYVGGIIFLVMMFLDGTNGPNRYGPDPKGRGDYWWEGDDGPPEGYREPAYTTQSRSAAPAAAAAPTQGGFGRRAQGFGRAQTSADLGAMTQDEWQRRLNSGDR